MLVVQLHAGGVTTVLVVQLHATVLVVQLHAGGAAACHSAGGGTTVLVVQLHATSVLVVQHCQLLHHQHLTTGSNPGFMTTLYTQRCAVKAVLGSPRLCIRKKKREKKRKTTQAAKHSLHELRKRRHIGPKCRESPAPKH